mgnify:CR=1 FL=1
MHNAFTLVCEVVYQNENAEALLLLLGLWLLHLLDLSLARVASSTQRLAVVDVIVTSSV